MCKPMYCFSCIECPPFFDHTGQIEYIEMPFKESGLAPLASATEKDVLAMSVLYIFYYSGEIILVSFQTVIIMYLRRSRIVLGTHFKITWFIQELREATFNEALEDQRRKK